ncbi:MAG: M48 family metallopeptidase [Nitriliruptorales bacterium]|nr:M48 family metallopeptidase [Nitriliruptorales bacterium]
MESGFETRAAGPSTPPDDQLEVRVIRSPRRRKTSQARLVDGVLVVRIPAALTRRDEDRTVQRFVERFERRRTTATIDLPARARSLAAELGLPEPTSIRWVDNQSTRWGSCTSATGTIRLSRLMAGFPAWVIDGVIVHELAHLAEPNHSPAFWALANRYPLMERTRGFLIAKGLED